MSRKYSKYWYPSIVDAIKNYNAPAQSEREKEVKDAIKETMKEELGERDGELTIKIIEMTMIKNTHTLFGAANEIPGLSERTARRLRTAFVYKVGHKLGY